MRKIVKILLIIQSFYNICFSMEQKPIPMLREIAFKQSIPKINQHIDVISNNNHSIIEKLKNVHNLIDVYGLPKEFIKDHPKINKLIKDCAIYSYNNMQNDPGNGLNLWNSFDSMPHFRKKLQAQTGGILLAEDGKRLSPVCVVGMPIYALCLLNNRMLFMPMNKIVSTLCGGKYPFLFTESLEGEAAKKINGGHQSAISQLQNEIGNGDEIFEYTFKSHIVYKNSSHYTFTLGDNEQHMINHVDVVYSHDGDRMLLIEKNKLIIENIRENKSTHEIDIPYTIKKACFSADDSTVFMIADGHVYNYDIEESKTSEWTVPHIIAIHPTQGKDFLMITNEDSEFYLYFVKLRNSKLEWKKSIYTLKEGIITAASFSKNGKWIAIGCNNSNIVLFNKKTNRQITIPLEDNELITRMIFSPCGSFFTAIINNNMIYIWHCDSAKLIQKFCPQMIHTIKACDENDSFAGEKHYNYCLPTILLSLPIDGDHTTIQELCDSNRAEGWCKTLNPLDLIVDNQSRRNSKDVPHKDSLNNAKSMWQYVYGIPILLGVMAASAYAYWHR